MNLQTTSPSAANNSYNAGNQSMPAKPAAPPAQNINAFKQAMQASPAGGNNISSMVGSAQQGMSTAETVSKMMNPTAAAGMSKEGSINEMLRSSTGMDAATGGMKNADPASEMIRNSLGMDPTKAGDMKNADAGSVSEMIRNSLGMDPAEKSDMKNADSVSEMIRNSLGMDPADKSQRDAETGMDKSDLSNLLQGLNADGSKAAGNSTFEQILKLIQSMKEDAEEGTQAPVSGLNSPVSSGSGNNTPPTAGLGGAGQTPGFMPSGGSLIGGPGGGITPIEGTGSGGGVGSGGGGKIPKPTEHIQELNLGGKTITVGGDGTASADEVQKTAQSIEQMYQNSPTFKNMIDNSSDPSFEVSVGRRSDNTSWGASDGRLFMNVNNIQPGNSDSWQSLLAHEFAHASIDLGHGAEMENLEDRAAREA